MSMQATGRTFRAILRALLAASEGKKVLVLCPRQPAAYRFITDCWDTLGVCGICGDEIARTSRVEIRIYGGSITAVSVIGLHPQELRGRPDITIIDDSIP